MAARKRIWTPDIVRERIQASMLVKRLSDHVSGKIEMSATQVRAAEILLRKAVPDLANFQHSGEIAHRYVIEAPAPADNPQEWAKQHAPAITRQ
jgi:hypothetical protein